MEIREFLTLLASLLLALSLVRMVAAYRALAPHIRWLDVVRHTAETMLPNGDDRRTAWESVDRQGWADLASVQMWSALAALSALGLLVMVLSS